MHKTRRTSVYMVGLPVTAKGIDDYEYLAKACPEFSFSWFCNDIKPEIRSKYPNINFEIGLSRSELLAKAKEKDIFCSCSRFENFPLPVGEAMMMKKPVFVYEIPEVVSIFDNLVQFVAEMDRQAMATALKKYADNGSYEGDVDAAYSFIQRTSSPRVVAAELLNILEG